MGRRARFGYAAPRGKPGGFGTEWRQEGNPDMAGASKGRVLRLLRTVHSWLGIVIFPWIVAIGATGFYLNHERAILPLIAAADYDESRFERWPGAAPAGREAAVAVAAAVWPGETVSEVLERTYHGRPVFELVMPPGRVIVVKPTGHYFVKTAYTRRTYAPDGTLLHRKVYWDTVLKRLHVRGWLGRGLGTWLADLTSLAMVLFGATGLVLFLTPRLGRMRRALGGRR